MKPKRITAWADVARASQSIGYAQGVLLGLADMCKLDDRQEACVDEAIRGLQEINLLKLTGSIPAGRRGKK